MQVRKNKTLEGDTVIDWQNKYLGSIQEDRDKVEQFHFLWNSSTICGTASQKMWTAPKKVEQVLKAGHCSKNMEQFHNL